MKKLLIFALCLLGICNASAEMMTAQEIILTEESHIQPWDSEERDAEIDFRPVSPSSSELIERFLEESSILACKMALLIRNTLCFATSTLQK